MLSNELVQLNFTLFHFLFGILVTSDRSASFTFRLCVTNIYKDLMVFFDLGWSLLVIVLFEKLKFRLKLI